MSRVYAKIPLIPMRAVSRVVALLLLLPAPAAAQREAFVDALIAFHSALAGTYGDEGARVLASLDRMAASLEVWERAGRTADASLTTGAPADLALHYLDQGQLADAIRAMEAAVQAEPRRAALHVFLGALHEAAGRQAEAAAAYRTAWTIEPRDPGHMYLAADLEGLMAAYARGERPRAPFLQLALVDDTTASTPVFAPAAYGAGFTAIAEGRYREAIERFREAAARDPLVADPAGRHERTLQGIAALKEKRGEAAVQHLQAAVAALPDSPEAHRVLGVVYRAMGRLPESLAAFDATIARAPRDERARIARGTTLAESGALDAAERSLRDTADMLPASGEARWALADVYERLGRGPDAIAVLQQAASLHVVAGKAALYWRIADLAHRQQDFERVVVELARRVRLRRNDPIAHRDLGMAHSRAGRNDEALLELLMAALLGHEDAEMLGAMGQIHLNAGRLDAAEPVLRRAIALDAQLPQPRYALGQTLLRLGRGVEAKQELDAFQRLRSAALADQRRSFEIETLMHEADLHVRAGRLEAAIAPYENAAGLGAPAEVYQRLAEIYEKLGRTAEQRKALAAYEQRRTR